MSSNFLVEACSIIFSGVERTMFNAVFDGLIDDESGDIAASDCTLAILCLSGVGNADCIGFACEYCD